MMVKLGRGDVKKVDRRGMAAARALRYGWVLGFKDAETMPLDDLKEAISARGMSGQERRRSSSMPCSRP